MTLIDKIFNLGENFSHASLKPPLPSVPFLYSLKKGFLMFSEGIKRKKLSVNGLIAYLFLICTEYEIKRYHIFHTTQTALLRFTGELQKEPWYVWASIFRSIDTNFSLTYSHIFYVEKPCVHHHLQIS